ncbi:hypothetical protein PORCRE_2094 [Porphyromonas crevioricanis JCM 15906]|uniref:Uncharacterized protein n=1 Tax=Porphyromonas crevioricanis JCM 15906 TaxID=1305617 RepID=T1CJA4_9PORP|nr:hypothetical protein PORCRE_2094 [Porphyromonas crevioricanis JCM 15906]SJZ98850.1 hypothetical protein SAMN02745203_01505 [Porphyromonas crevioricanis]
MKYGKKMSNNVTFEPSQLTVKSNEVFFISFLLLSLSARSSRKKRAVGKSADCFTLSVLLERLSAPSLLVVNHLV